MSNKQLALIIAALAIAVTAFFIGMQLRPPKDVTSTSSVETEIFNDATKEDLTQEVQGE